MAKHAKSKLICADRGDSQRKIENKEEIPRFSISENRGDDYKY